MAAVCGGNKGYIRAVLMLVRRWTYLFVASHEIRRIVVQGWTLILRIDFPYSTHSTLGDR